MQLKNVGVIVVILVPRHNTLTVQGGKRGREQFLFFFFSLAYTHINTCTHSSFTHTQTHTQTLIFVVHF